MELTSETFCLFKKLNNGQIPKKENCVKFYIHCSVHHYNCSKIITNKMTLLDYPLFQG